ncbi:MAG: hypothetical protein ABJF23_34135 [Bryobacteraceae bacterium]
MTSDLFQDEVIRATELNRTSGEILNKAARAPITIVRNDEMFALMRREVAAEWRREASSAVHMAEIIFAAMANSPSVPPEHQWINAFDKEQKAEMASELIEAYRKAIREERWEEFDAILHEWSESGWAALTEAMNAVTDLVEIPTSSIG